MSRIDIWTIGHGEGSYDELERRLEGIGPVNIVDVRPQRSAAAAPDFQGARLAALARETGRGYRWLGPAFASPVTRGEAGAPPEGAGAHFDDGITELTALAVAAPTVLLCTEPDPASCRRATLIAPELERRGFRVVHILGDGARRPHHPGLPFDD